MYAIRSYYVRPMSYVLFLPGARGVLEPLDFVAQLGGTLEFEILGCLAHFVFELFDQFGFLFLRHEAQDGSYNFV